MKKTVVLLALGIFLFSGISQVQAQFSKAVVVMKGVVTSAENGKAHSVKVSVRAAGDKALEITSSTSNSESGNYLVVLQPAKKYWVHLEGEDILTTDELIETPSVLHTEQLKKDFAVTTISVAKSQSQSKGMGSMQ